MANFYGKPIDTKILILSKGEGCKYCTQLDMFLNLALGGEYNDKFTKILESQEPEYYNQVVDGEAFMQAPMIINTETREAITGFDASEVLRILQNA